MKKSILLTNLIWFLITASLMMKSCSATPESEISKAMAEANSLQDGDIILNYKDKPFKGISINAAKELASKYARRAAAINKNEKINDARSVWFSLEEIEQLSWIIRYYTEQAGVGVDGKDLGIRIYYGVYPNREIMGNFEDFNTVDKNYANLHTVFMVPTYRKDDLNLDYDPRFNYKQIKANKAKGLQPLSEQLGKLADNGSNTPLWFTQTSEESTILNHANLCPPCIRE